MVNYLGYLKAERGLQPSSIATARQVLRDFSSFNRKRFEWTTKTDMQSYLYHLDRAGRAPRTKRKAVSILRSFFQWLLDEDERLTDTQKVSLTRLLSYLNTRVKIRVEKTLPQVLSPEEVNRLRQAPNGRNQKRDRCLLELLLCCGLRRSEILGLSRNDIDLDTGKLMVRQGKGQKDRFVPLSERCRDALRDYLNDCSDRLFPLSPPSINLIVQKYARSAGIKKRVYPHLLRHTYITRLVSQTDRTGMNLFQIAQIAGHSRLETTRLYTHLSDDEIQKAYGKVVI